MSANGPDSNGPTSNGPTPNGDSAEDRKLIATAGTEARRGSFGPGGGVGIPTERSDKFGETLKRLGEILGKERPRLLGVIVATVISVVLVVIGPRLLGEATNIIVEGFSRPGGIDFAALHRQLLIVAAVYVVYILERIEEVEL